MISWLLLALELFKPSVHWNAEIANRVQQSIGIAIDAAREFDENPFVLLAIATYETEINNHRGGTGYCCWGVGQVYWEMHENTLKKEKIASQARDLLRPEVGFRTMAHVLAKSDQTAPLKRRLCAYGVGLTPMFQKWTTCPYAEEVVKMLPRVALAWVMK